MDQRTQGALLLAVGGVSVRLGLTGTALNFIKPGYVPLLVAAGVILLVMGAVTLVAALRETHDPGRPAEPDLEAQTGTLEPHGHDHSSGPKVAWMLAAPLFAILLIAPPPLGAFAAARQSGAIRAATTSFPELPAAEDGAIPMSLGDFAARGLYDTERSLEGERVRLTGFVSGSAEQGWMLTRFALSCCAADGTAVDVQVLGGGPAPPVDTWVEVEGTWTPRPGHEIGELTAEAPMLEATSVTPIPQPEQPYES